MNKKNDKKKRKSTKYWFETAQNQNEMIEQKRQEFVRNVSQRPEGIVADRAKFPDGVKTGSYKYLPSDD